MLTQRQKKIYASNIALIISTNMRIILKDSHVNEY